MRSVYGRICRRPNAARYFAVCICVQSMLVETTAICACVHRAMQKKLVNAMLAGLGLLRMNTDRQYAQNALLEQSHRMKRARAAFRAHVGSHIPQKLLRARGLRGRHNVILC